MNTIVPQPVKAGSRVAAATVTFVCVICGGKYDPKKATAERRGFCTRRCETKLERKHGLHKKAPTCLGREAARRAFWVELRAMRRGTPGADPNGFLRTPA